MIPINVSRHAEARIRQRGLRHEDIHFVCPHGTETAKGYLLTEKDAAALEAEARHILLKAQRLRGVLVPVAGVTAKTVLRATRCQQRRLL
jgi:hypothetical protein